MDEIISIIKSDVCRNCMYIAFGGDVCIGEALPVEKAIERNLRGQGLCDDVKRYVDKLKGSDEEWEK